MHTFPVGRSERHYLLICIVLLTMLLSGCAKQEKGSDPPPPIPLPSVELSAIPSETLSGTTKQTGPPLLLLPPSEELRSQMGKIRISDRRVQPELEFSKPVGAVEGALKGAGFGLGISPLLILNPFYIAMVPAVPIISTVRGVQKSLPEAKVKEFEQTFRATIQELNVPHILRQQVADRIQALHLSEITGDSDPSAPINLDVVVNKVRLYHDFFLDPYIFAFTGSTRLLRATDGEELYSHAFVITGQELALEEWLAGDAAKLRQEVDRCCHELADLIVEEVFLLYLPDKNFLLSLPEKKKE